MACLGLEAAVLFGLGLLCFLIHFIHFVCVSVVGSNKSNTVELIYNVDNSLELKVERFH